MPRCSEGDVRSENVKPLISGRWPMHRKMIPTCTISKPLKVPIRLEWKLLTLLVHSLAEPIVREASFDIREQALYVQFVQDETKLTYV
jgi:hypothetical protein